MTADPTPADPEAKKSAPPVAVILTLIAVLLSSALLLLWVQPHLLERKASQDLPALEKSVRALSARISGNERYADGDFSGISTQEVRAFAINKTFVDQRNEPIHFPGAWVEVFPSESGQAYWVVLEVMNEAVCMGLVERFADVPVLVNHRTGAEACDRLRNTVRLEFGGTGASRDVAPKVQKG